MRWLNARYNSHFTHSFHVDLSKDLCMLNPQPEEVERTRRMS
jgi:hypothetical protein